MDYPIPPDEPTPAPPEPPVRAIPEGTRTVTPHLVVRNGASAIDFYNRAFGAVEVYRMPGPGGALVHAELQLGDSRIYLADEAPAMGAKSPKAYKGTPVTIHLYVEDVDATFERAVRAGAKVVRPVEDQFWGDRYGQVEDPFGHMWSIATHKEDVEPAEMMRRAEEFFASMPPPPKPARKKTAKKKASRKKAAGKKPARKKAKKKGSRKKVAKKARKKTSPRKKKGTRKKAAGRKTAKKKSARRKTARRKSGKKKKRR